jgi:hypothetical protein
MTAKDAMFKQIFDEAWKAGEEAASALIPVGMFVGQPTTMFGNDIDFTKPVDYIPDGVCGFAWVKLRPANSPFANWLKKNGKARKAYDGGVDIWIGSYNQSMQKKEAHAAAMAESIRSHGISAYSMSRMD